MNKVRNSPLTLALAGFLFGFEAFVISRTNLPIKELWLTKPLFWIGMLFLVPAVGSVPASNPYFFSFFRFVEGIGLGVSAVAALTYISEILPHNIRANGQSFRTGIHYIFATLITLTAPVVIDLFKVNLLPIFAHFTFIIVLQLIFAVFVMSGNKGLKLENLENKLLNNGK
ncbi:MFS transporter [Flavobacterium frigoris]|uniref:Xylose transporter n=1 Tax=Flavobacterium frigoris (strain PS1) TaxID=1086011 RepID=H7FQ42_FLAFP|nr:MFS transporter [Flavobacterium frigoris]EIA09396.1 xylose transporter [Flavobacterium frigoris PS1]